MDEALPALREAVTGLKDAADELRRHVETVPPESTANAEAAKGTASTPLRGDIAG